MMTKKSENDMLLNSPSKAKWEAIGTRRRSGVVAPLFSLYSQRSLGIGDFNDLKLLIDWAHKTGNSIVQLLPMNEVGGTFCPYDSHSCFALEPMYVCVDILPHIKKKSIKEKIEQVRRAVTVGRMYVDYRIKEEKLKLLWEIFCLEKDTIPAKFEKFIAKNEYWLNDFALFKALKDYHGGKAWFDWPQEYKGREPKALSAFVKDNSAKVNFQMWVQWVLYEQFKDAKEYARSKDVLLKGDLPILASFDSADVWAHPEYFKLEFAAGAPPDMYCEKGQRWGTPTYNWERIAAEGYQYLKEKLAYAENFYDILRIDHVVGLFRIWSIHVHEPMENKGFNGFFDPPEEYKWKEHGKSILSVMLENTRMLLCAEDLGVIPVACTETLQELDIPGNDVSRWAKDWNRRHDFLPPEEYRQMAVAMLSTHDTTNWAAWWENEAGTVDEALFIRKCTQRGIDFAVVKNKLFDPVFSRHGRLRWQKSVSSVEMLLSVLGRRREEVMDFIDMYENSYQEKEKLWKQFAIAGPMREKADPQIVAAACKLVLDSKAVFCLQMIIDWLSLAGLFEGDPYQYRINTPGIVDQKNWSLVLPLPLEELLEHKINDLIKDMVVASGRA